MKKTLISITILAIFAVPCVAQTIVLGGSGSIVVGESGNGLTWVTLPGGTNVSSAFVLGTGSSLTTSGSGTNVATNLSGTPALPNGTTATTQTTSDASTKLATDSFAHNVVNTAVSGTTGLIPVFTSSTAVGNSHIDDGVTTVGVVTSSEPIAVTGAPMFKTGTSSNSDVNGILTASSGTATYTFAGTYASSPVCIVQDDTTISNLLTKTVSTTVLTVTTTGSTDHVSYVCIGRN